MYGQQPYISDCIELLLNLRGGLSVKPHRHELTRHIPPGQISLVIGHICPDIHPPILLAPWPYTPLKYIAPGRSHLDSYTLDMYVPPIHIFPGQIPPRTQGNMTPPK